MRGDPFFPVRRALESPDEERQSFAGRTDAVNLRCVRVPAMWKREAESQEDWRKLSRIPVPRGNATFPGPLCWTSGEENRQKTEDDSRQARRQTASPERVGREPGERPQGQK